MMVVFAFAKAFIAPLHAQEDTGLSQVLAPETAVKQMLESNFGIILANNQLTIAENNKSLLNAGFLPSLTGCLLYTSPSPRDQRGSRMPSSA